jgi:small conductance mechanosensitive channel
MASGDFFGINGESLFFFIVLIMVTLSLARTAYALFRHFFEPKIGKRRSKKYARGIQYLIIAGGLSFGMTNILEIDVATVAATLGLAGIVVALASQQILQNLMAGMLIGMERQIQLEDWIDIGGSPDTKPARVKDITLTKTILLDPQGKLIVVPNSYIVGGKVINYTKAGFFEVPLRLTVSMESDLELVKKVILDVADKDPFILPNVPGSEKHEVEKVMHLRQLRSLFENKVSYDMFKPRVLVGDISDGKLTLSIRIWIREINRKDDVVSDFLSALFLRFREEQILLS